MGGEGGVVSVVRPLMVGAARPGGVCGSFIRRLLMLGVGGWRACGRVFLKDIYINKQLL